MQNINNRLLKKSFGKFSLLQIVLLIMMVSFTLVSCNSNDGAEYNNGRPSSTEDILPELDSLESLDEAPKDEVNVSYAPEVPKRAKREYQAIIEVKLDVIEGVCPLDPKKNVDTLMWGFRVSGDDEITCGSPGPVLRGRVGDMFRFTLTNLASNEHPHNIDFHAVTGQGGGAEGTTVAPGETATIDSRLLYPGAFMYHCAFGDVPEHIAKGMYGMIIVDPEVPLPKVDHEWAIMQSEWYVGDAVDGVATFDRDALKREEPKYVTFNGRTDALSGDNALKMKVGQRSRIYMVNEGLNLTSNFHAIGSHWDVVYPEAATHPINKVIRGSQSTSVVAGGGTVTEVLGVVPTTIILVDHALSRTFYKGALGQIEVTGKANKSIFSQNKKSKSGGHVMEEMPASKETTTTMKMPDSKEAPQEKSSVKVTIPSGAFDPANASKAYSPLKLEVKVGTTVTWTNKDSMPHTVTSGVSDGSLGKPDNIFDSGNFAKGETFSYTFDEVGEFPYFCIPHPWMKASVTVVA